MKKNPSLTAQKICDCKKENVCFLTQDSKNHHEEEQQEKDVNKRWEGLKDLTQISDGIENTWLQYVYTLIENC